MFLTKNSGICAACGKNRVCTYTRDNSQPVASCEEFDGFAMTKPAAGSIAPQAHSWMIPEEEEFSGEPGLCGTCRKQSECGGTDQTDCENYR